MSKAFIFDLDGTLVDSFEAHYLALRDVFRENFGVEFRRGDFRGLFGKLAPEIIRTFLEEKSVDYGDADFKALSDRKRVLFRDNYVGEVQVIEGVRDFLDRLVDSGMPMAVASNSIRLDVDAILDAAGLTDYFPVTVAVDEVDQPKPDPEMFHKAAGLLGADPNDCVVVDDSVYGVKAGLDSGMETIAVLTGGATRSELEDVGADFIVEHLRDVDLDAL